MDLRLADPSRSWKNLAEQFGFSERHLYRIRKSTEWKEVWQEKDKEFMIESLRAQALSAGNAAHYNAYFDITGALDPEAALKLLRMDDETAIRIAKDARNWLENQK